MDLLQLIGDIFNAILGLLGAILSFLEQLLSPILDLIDRWNNLFGDAG